MSASTGPSSPDLSSLDLRSPFSHRAAVKAGISRPRLASSEFRRIIRGVYIDAGVRVDALVEGRAALLVGAPDAFLSHHTAARLWGGVVPHSPDLHLSVPPTRTRSPREGLVVHRSRRTPQTFRGLRVTTPLGTFLDCATVLDLVDLVVLGDSLVKKRRITPEQLIDGASRATGRGSRFARRAAALVREGVDSPMESRARMLRVLSGLPELEADIRFYGPDGQLLRRLDAGDSASRTAVEYDGRQHVEREEQWEADLGRREEFEDDEWRIITLVSKDIYRTPEATVMRQRRIFRARGMVVGAPKDEWRRYFPGQAWSPAPPSDSTRTTAPVVQRIRPRIPAQPGHSCARRRRLGIRGGGAVGRGARFRQGVRSPGWTGRRAALRANTAHPWECAATSGR